MPRFFFGRKFANRVLLLNLNIPWQIDHPLAVGSSPSRVERRIMEIVSLRK